MRGELEKLTKQIQETSKKCAEINWGTCALSSFGAGITVMGLSASIFRRTTIGIIIDAILLLSHISMLIISHKRGKEIMEAICERELRIVRSYEELFESYEQVYAGVEEK